MTGQRRLFKPSALRESLYYLTYRTTAGGVERLEATSEQELARFLGKLRSLGASDITVVDMDGRLVSFECGS